MNDRLIVDHQKTEKMTTEVSQSSPWMMLQQDGGDAGRSIAVPMGRSVLGRGTATALCVPVPSVSKRHAVINASQNSLAIEDLGSTNGTYINGIRVTPPTPQTIADGDLIQFANSCFRVQYGDAACVDGTMQEGVVQWAQTLLTFERLIDRRAVIPHYQPILRYQPDGETVVGYEVLARSNLPELASPAEMFGIASRLGQDAVLSEMMRTEAAKLLVAHDWQSRSIYVNTHPVEFGTEQLATSLEELRDAFPTLPLTIEVHEKAVTRIEQMRAFRTLLDRLDMRLSYDDFGAGEGRLMELAEVPPDVLKFDMSLIRDIDAATATRQRIVASLVTMAHDAGALALAEGVETSGEDAVCRELGFDLVQGFHHARPMNIDDVQKYRIDNR